MWKNLLFFAIALALMAFTGRAHAAPMPLTDANLPQALEALLRERPDLVLDVLRHNSEAVLDIAQQGSNQRRLRSLEAQWKEDVKHKKSVRLEGRPVLGPANARVRIVAFSDFTCHFCQQASVTLEALMRAYSKDVCLVFKHLPLDEKGIGAQAAAWFVAIAGQDAAKAWQFYRSMYAERDTLLAEGEAFLKKTAETLGLDMKRLAKDVRSKKVQAILAEDAADAQQVGVEGTPHFLVNDVVVRGALPLDLFKRAVDMALRQTGQATP